MREAIVQSIDNLRANKLRSFLTMFGILWGVIAVVVLSATGEGFRRGNQTRARGARQEHRHRLGRPHHACRPAASAPAAQIFLTVDDARAIAAESPLAAVVSPEINRGGMRGEEPLQRRVARRCTASSRSTRRSAPSTSSGAAASAGRTRARCGASRSSAPTPGPSSSPRRDGLGEIVQINGVPYTVVGKIRKKDQDSNYSGPDNDKVFVPFAAMARDFPRTNAPPDALSQIIVAPQP